MEARRDTFTRDELVAAMRLSPCRITGVHDPQHTPKYICTHQLKDALEGLLDLLGITAGDLPRGPHTWPATGATGVLEDAWVNRRPITFTVSTLPGESWSDFGSAWNAGCEARKATGGQFSVEAFTDGLDEPARVAWW